MVRSRGYGRDQAIFQAQCGGLFGCETWHPARDFQRADNGALALYRGGDFSNVEGHYKLDAEGNVKAAGKGGRGPSLFDDPAKIPPRFTEINKVGLLPPELTTIQTRPGHFEVVPREAGMSPGRFVELLQKIPKEPIE